MKDLDNPSSMAEPLILGVLNIKENGASLREICADIFKIKYLSLFDDALRFYCETLEFHGSTQKHLIVCEVVSQKPHANSLKNNVLLVLLKSRKSPTIKEIVYKIGRYKKYLGTVSEHRVYQVISELKKEPLFRIDKTKEEGKYVEHRYILGNIFDFSPASLHSILF